MEKRFSILAAASGVLAALMVLAVAQGSELANVVLIAILAFVGALVRELRLDQQARVLSASQVVELDTLRKELNELTQAHRVLDSREAEFGRRLTTVENRTRPVGKG